MIKFLRNNWGWVLGGFWIIVVLFVIYNATLENSQENTAVSQAAAQRHAEVVACNMTVSGSQMIFDRSCLPLFNDLMNK